MTELVQIRDYLKSIDDKTNKTSDFKSLMFLVSWNSIYEPPTDTSKKTIIFSPPITLDSLDYEIALMDIETYYSFPNITKGINNVFRYYSGFLSKWINVEFDTGAYEISQISSKLNEIFHKNGEIIHNEAPIRLEGNGATLKCEMSIDAGYIVDFTHPNSFNKLLGFRKAQYNEGIYESDFFVDIMEVDSLYVNCDLINNSFSNGKNSTAIYSFFPSVSPGSKIVEKATYLVFLPINRRVLSSITFWLSDQDGKIINFRNLNISIRFYLRKTPFK